MARSVNLQAIRARVERLSQAARGIREHPCLEEFIAGHRFDEADPTLTLEDIVAASLAVLPSQRAIDSLPPLRHCEGE